MEGTTHLDKSTEEDTINRLEIRIEPYGGYYYTDGKYNKSKFRVQSG